MSIIKLMSVEFDTEKRELTGGVASRIEKILSEEQMKDIDKAMRIVAEAFGKDSGLGEPTKVEEVEEIEVDKPDLKEINKILEDIIRTFVPNKEAIPEIKTRLMDGVINSDKETEMLIKLSGLSKAEFLAQTIEHFENLVK